MSLFVGGLMDGEWHRVERHFDGNLPKNWTLAGIHQPRVTAPWALLAAGAHLQDNYKLMEFEVEGNKYHVYRHYKLKPAEAFEIILCNYTHKEIEL
jgi:hypothetical protein